MGCKKSTDQPQPRTADNEPARKPAAVGDSPETVARFHWLGSKGLRADTNSAYFMTIWDLPETGKLLAQTLDKLALLPLRMKDNNWTTNAPATNATSVLLRPLLDDLVAEESWVEIHRRSNQIPQFVIAARLPEPRAAAWETNLAAALEQLTGQKSIPAPSGRGWSLKKHDAPNLFQFVRVGQWTAIGLGYETNPALRAVLDRIQLTPPAHGGVQSNLWIQARIDLPAFLNLIAPSFRPPVTLPTADFDIRGDGQNVLTRGEMDFPKPLPFEIEKWNIPTNLIHGPLVSMLAVQGIRPLLSSLNLPPELGLASLPNQYFSWVQQGAPFLVFAGFPVSSGSNAMCALTNSLCQVVNPWLAENTRALRIEPSINAHGVEIRAPAVSPHLEAVVTPGGEFLFAGLMPGQGLTHRTVPAETVNDILDTTNLVFFHREVSPQRIEGYLYITQLGRVMARRIQMAPDAASVSWIKAAGLSLGGSHTVVIKTGSNRLSFSRKSGFGLTSLEIHLLADWLESPTFPKGLFTLVLQVPRPSSGTNQPLKMR